MAARSKITVDEWLSELSKSDSSDEGFSTRDAARILGVAIFTAGEKLRAWSDQGLIKCVGRREERTKDGRRSLIPVYSVVKQKKK